MNLIILGPQGSGKGTQAEKLAEKFCLEHIDMGKFLREVAKMNTPLGREVYEIQNVTKTLVPSRILEEAFTLKLGSIPREQGIIFDGVPRTMDQAEYLDKSLLEFGRKINAVIIISLSETESIKRISNRRICEKCKRVLILGKDIHAEEEGCPDCGGSVVRRIDDSEEGIRKRLQVFKDETMPVIEYYREKGKLIEIDGNRTIEEVFEDISARLENI